ncbi:hypothetical protein ACFV2U_02535, partial [Streptomyces sp. NPDC059697]
MKRTVLAASAFSVALLAGPAGCASGDSDAADEPTPEASRAKEPGPARRLATQMITAADLGHGYSVRDFSVAKEKSAFAETPDRITVDRRPCHPLAAAMNQLPLGRPQAFLTRVVSPEKSVGTPAEETTGTPAEETTGTPAEETTGTPAEETTGTPAEETTGTPAEETTGTPAEEETTGTPALE